MSSEYVAAIAALAGLCLTLLGALVGTIWKASSLVTELKGAAKAMAEQLKTLEKRLELLESIPTLVRDVAQLKDERSAMGKRVDTLWEKFFSHDKHIAVTQQMIRQSRPDFGGNDD